MIAEFYKPQCQKVPVQREHNQIANPFVMCFNIGMQEMNNFCHSKLSEEDKENFKDNIFYPIEIRQNRDLSYDITFGVFR